MESGSFAAYVFTTISRMRFIAYSVRLLLGAFLFVISIMLATTNSWADEGGVSFWLPGIYGSLAAVPGQPGFSFITFNYYDSVRAGADVARAREIQIGRFDPTLTLNLNANLKATIDLQWLQPGYTFATPVLGGQAYVGLGAFFGRNRTSLDGTLTASVTHFNFVRSGGISDSVNCMGYLLSADNMNT